MKKAALLFIVMLLLAACAAPVIKKDLLAQGLRNVPISEIAGHPGKYKDRMFVLGGIIANTTVSDKGTFIEALFFPVDDKGYFKNESGMGRFIAFWPRANGILDPLLYRQNRRITVAGTLAGTMKGKIGSASYVFPVIDVLQIHLWSGARYYYPPYYYYPYYPYDYWYPYPPYWGYGFYW